MMVLLQLLTLFLFFAIANSLLKTQPIIKSHGYSLCRARPLQTASTGLLSHIPRLEYGIRALFRSREPASFYDFDLPFTMDWKITQQTTNNSEKLFYFQIIPTLKSIASKLFPYLKQVFATASIIASSLHATTLKFTQFLQQTRQNLFQVESLGRFEREKMSLREELAKYRWQTVFRAMEISM